LLAKLTSADFSPYLNQKFRIHLEAPLEVDLIEVNDLGPELSAAEAAKRRQPFALIFRDPSKTYLPQRIYRIEHAELGTLDLFLVPIGPDEHGMCYEVVFN
jgi:hypothetical protein